MNFAPCGFGTLEENQKNFQFAREDVQQIKQD